MLHSSAPTWVLGWHGWDGALTAGLKDMDIFVGIIILVPTSELSHYPAWYLHEGCILIILSLQMEK